MEKSKENNNEKNFLKEGLQGDISKHHKEYLGTSVPKGYFTKSKLSILEKIKEEAKIEEQPKKQVVFWMQPKFRYMAAASLVFILSLTIWLQRADDKIIDNTNIEFLAFEEDVLINSLFIEDAQLESFADATLMNEIVIKAELSEQKMDDLILDSMILDDSLSDSNFIETLIL